MATTKSTTKKKTASKKGKKVAGKKHRPPGSPIIIGGGRRRRGPKRSPVSLKFRFSDYPVEPGDLNKNKKKFRDYRSRINRLVVNGNDLSESLPANRKCTITVHCYGNDNDVNIHGNPFGIEFDTRTYKPNLADYTNDDESGYIYQITGKYFDDIDVAEGEECIIVADCEPRS